jgi:hypothetical protein
VPSQNLPGAAMHIQALGFPAFARYTAGGCEKEKTIEPPSCEKRCRLALSDGLDYGDIGACRTDAAN